MFPYWLLFSVIALGALVKSGAVGRMRGDLDPMLVIALATIAVMIGFRFEVGGDWWTYSRYYSFASLATFDQIINKEDPGYQLINWVAAKLGAGLWLVNLVCGTVFSWGLHRLIRSQPFPWLSLLVAIPYLIIVVAMGYSRQGIAIGVLMAGTAGFQRNGSILRYALYVIVAALFHRTAVIGLPLLMLGGQRGLIVNTLIVIFGSLLLYNVFLAESIDRFVNNYLTSEMSSQGAVIRVAMNVVPAVIFLIFHKRLNFSQIETNIWRNFSYATIVLLIALVTVSSSTVIDRLALYILPLQLAVIPRIAGTLVREREGKLMIVLYCFAIQFVWLTFAAHSNYWVPYQVFPVGGSV